MRGRMFVLKLKVQKIMLNQKLLQFSNSRFRFTPVKICKPKMLKGKKLNRLIITFCFVFVGNTFASDDLNFSAQAHSHSENSIHFTYDEMLVANPIDDFIKITNVNEYYLIKLVGMSVFTIPGVDEKQKQCWKNKVTVKEMWMGGPLERIRIGSTSPYDAVRYRALISTYASYFNELMAHRIKSIAKFKCNF